MSEQKVYQVAQGFVQFEPKPGTANNKPVRYVQIRAVGTQKTVYVTVWDNHAHIPLAQGDLITTEGEYRPNKSSKDGVERTFHNLSAKLLINHGSGLGKRTGVANAPAAEDTSDEDAPF